MLLNPVTRSWRWDLVFQVSSLGLGGSACKVYGAYAGLHKLQVP